MSRLDSGGHRPSPPPSPGKDTAPKRLTPPSRSIARPVARSVALARSRPRALHGRPSLLPRQPPLAGAGGRRGLHAAAWRDEGGPDEGGDLGPRVLQVARLGARRLARNH